MYLCGSVVGSYPQALVEIGDYIQSCLSEFTTEEEGRTNLWIFVSKFTKDTSEALKILYSRAKKEVESDKHQVGSDPWTTFTYSYVHRE